MLSNTNIYENETGVVPISPVSLTGKYKIYVSIDGKLYLDDYNGRRQPIDNRKLFLPQVANFLKIDTSSIDNNKLRYGGFRNNKSLSYHTTLYLSDNQKEYPEVFVLNTLTDFGTKNHFEKSKYPNINNKASIFHYIDLNKIGLTKIFEEINNTFRDNQNMFFNSFEDSYLMLQGYGIMEECFVQKYYDLKYLQANQTDFNYVNSKILDAYQEFKIIYPRFINIEFEFEYKLSFKGYQSNFYQNFYGFYSKYSYDFINTEYPTIRYFINEEDKPDFIRIKNNDDLIDNKNNPKFYDIIINNVVITNYSLRNPQIRFSLKQLNSGDYIKIHHKDTSIIYEYEFSDEDFESGNNMFSVLKQALNKISLETNNMFYFQLNNRYQTNKAIEVILEFSEIDEFVEEYYVELSKNFNLLDDTKYFRKINNNDYRIVSEIEKEHFQQINKVKLNNEWLNIVDKFYFNGYPFLRFKNVSKINNDKLNIISIYGKEQSKLIQFKPIPWLKYNDDLSTEKQYNNLNYIGFLKSIFPHISSNFESNLEIYKKNILFEDKFPFVNETQTNHISEIKTENYNSTKIQSIIFNSVGCGTHKNPVVFNIDKRWYEKSNLINYNYLENDEYKYHWFLIKTDYNELLDDKRYFKDKPQITSRLIRSFENSLYCETVFLGVKYRLPALYSNYQFAVYLNCQNILNPKLHYKFVVNNDEKTIYLEINKFFDFVDVIRGGIEDNKPFLDLSFIYNANKTYNSNSTNIFDFDYGGLLICDSKIPIMWNNTVLNDWKVYDDVTQKWYIAIKKSITTFTKDLTELVDSTVGSDYTYYLYSTITDKYGNTFNYLSVKYIIKNIQQVDKDYIWAEDLIIKFYDSEDYYIEIDNDGISDYYVINDTHDVVSTERLLNNQVINKTVIIPQTGNQIKLKFLNNNYEFSLKREYWNYHSETKINSEGKLVTNKSIFTFPEFNLLPSTNDIYTRYLDDIDMKAKNSDISIFERNQLWLMIKELSGTNIQMKASLSSNKLFNDLLLYHLEKYSISNSIPVSNIQDRFVKLDVFDPDLNVVIWNESINRIQRISTWYQPLLTKCTDEYEFQKQLYLNNVSDWRINSLYSIFDVNYGGKDISATGIYKEVFGNILSSMFVIYDDIIIETLIDDVNSNLGYYDLIKSQLLIDKLILQNKNETYIQQFNKNIDEYIFETFIKELFTIYKLDEVIDIRDNKRLEFINLQDYKVNVLNYKGPVKLIFRRQ